jgi:solute carrier family 6 GABA transporter-like protein 1
MCCLLFALGLPMCTEGGVFLFQLMDFYSASGMALLWVCFFQTIAIGWFFGTERYRMPRNLNNQRRCRH